ncbi:SGNH/GDSL hydrolase family protein [Sphingobacterium sp. WOUb80]|uniref:SGNH/GDSL hydrolase family protein n=1 Tax=Sphingobacterium sp. WOUb80 TaxID=3234028 RepID=UPI003CEC9A16
MKKNKLYIGAALALLAIASCKPSLDEYTPSAGSVNFSKYVAIGNSLTAGYADGGLYLEGQKVAYPNLIAEQLKQVGGGEFKSPFFSEDQANGSGYITLTALVNGQPVTAQVTDKLAYRSASPKLLTKYTDPINNLGVPGMRMDLSMVAGMGSPAGNMYFERLLPDADAKKTYFTYSTTQNHTFFSFALGNNDALGWATNGGVVDGPTTVLTETAQFTGILNGYVQALTEGDRKGVLATIPDVTATPYFTTVTKAALLGAVNAASKGNFQDIFIKTKTGVRKSTDKDYFILTLSSAGVFGQNGTGLYEGIPLDDKWVLDESEVTTVQTRINEYNAAIKAAANSKGLALADVHEFLNNVKDGVRINGLAVSAKYITGNAFSLDGIHLTPIGNALMANIFISAINSKYGSKIPQVDVAKYRGVKLPDTVTK